MYGFRRTSSSAPTGLRLLSPSPPSPVLLVPTRDFRPRLKRRANSYLSCPSVLISRVAGSIKCPLRESTPAFPGCIGATAIYYSLLRRSSFPRVTSMGRNYRRGFRHSDARVSSRVATSGTRSSSIAPIKPTTQIQV